MCSVPETSAKWYHFVLETFAKKWGYFVPGTFAKKVGTLSKVRIFYRKAHSICFALVPLSQKKLKKIRYMQ